MTLTDARCFFNRLFAAVCCLGCSPCSVEHLVPVWEQKKKKSSLFIFGVLSKTGSTGRRRSYVTEMFASVVSGVKSRVIYLFLILKQQFSAGVFLLQVSFSVGCGFPQAPSRCRHCFRPLCSYSARRQFQSFLFFFIQIKEVAESGIPAAHFYNTWTLRCCHRRKEEEKQLLHGQAVNGSL